MSQKCVKLSEKGKRIQRKKNPHKPRAKNDIRFGKCYKELRI